MYHIDPASREPVHCRFGTNACPLGTNDEHYGSISEAVRERSFPKAVVPVILSSAISSAL